MNFAFSQLLFLIAPENCSNDDANMHSIASINLMLAGIKQSWRKSLLYPVYIGLLNHWSNTKSIFWDVEYC
jgi:hypothetical protein